MELTGFRQFGGAVPELSALRRVMIFHRAICRQTSQAPSEAMLFGLAGGPGFSYFDAPGAAPSLRVGPSYNNRPGELLQQLCVRLGLPASFRHSADPALTRRAFARAIEQGDPVIAYARPEQLPWLVRRSGGGPVDPHPVVIFALDAAGVARVSDVTPLPQTLDAAQLEAACGRGTSCVGVVVGPSSSAIDLPRCVDAGVRACYERLLDPPHPRSAHGVGAIGRMAAGLGELREPNGWMKLAPRGAGLLGALVGAFQAIALDGRDPDGGRGLYATFLREAADVLQDMELGDVAARYETLATAWRAFGVALLPDEVPTLAALRQALVARETGLRAGADPDALAGIAARFGEALSAAGADYPLSEPDTRRHLAQLRDQLSAIAGLEEEAARVLRLARR